MTSLWRQIDHFTDSQIRQGNIIAYRVKLIFCFLLTFTLEDQNKTANELYALINYGELRKKIKGVIDSRTGQKLNELVKKG